MKIDDFFLKYNVELFTINHLVNIAKSKGLKSVCIEPPLFKISYDSLLEIMQYLAENKRYSEIGVTFPDRRNANHPSGIYSEKTLTIHWE